VLDGSSAGNRLDEKVAKRESDARLPSLSTSRRRPAPDQGAFNPSAVSAGGAQRRPIPPTADGGMESALNLNSG
jgi:hypothetical protein